MFEGTKADLQPNLTTSACLGAWYTRGRMLQTSLEGKTFYRQIYHPLSLKFRNLDLNFLISSEKKIINLLLGLVRYLLRKRIRTV